MFAAVTGGWIVGLVALAILLLICVGWFIVVAILSSDDAGSGGRGMSKAWLIPPVLTALVVLGVWWWASAFTTSHEYHAWNIKEGTVAQVSNRLIPAGDKGAMAQRFVVKFSDGSGPYGIDDTRASLIKTGQHIRLECKRDYQFGQPREFNGWACRWREAVQ